MKRPLRAEAPRMLFVANLDRFFRIVLPHLSACRDRGWRVDVACPVTDFADEVQLHCDTLYDTSIRRFPLNPLNLLALSRIVRLIRKNRYDIVHAHTPSGGFVGRCAATLTGVPVRMYTAHGFHFHPEGNPLTNFLFSRLEQYAGHHWSDWVETVNEHDYDAARAWNIVPSHKLLRVEGTGVDSARFNESAVAPEDATALRRKYDLPDAGPVLGTIAEMIPRKRIADVIDALALVRAEFPAAVLLVLGVGPLQSVLEDQARRLGVFDACRFVGFQRDTPRHLALMDVFVFASQQEGLPVALMEAMSMARPVVATDIRGNRDLVRSGISGLLAPVGRPDALAAGCLQFLRDPHLASELRQAARQTILDRFENEVIVEKQMEFYLNALSAARRASRLRPNLSFEALSEEREELVS